MTDTAAPLPTSAPTSDAPSTSANTYTIRPNFKQKFRPTLVQKLMHQILTEKLTGAQYHPDTCSQWAREISDEVKSKLKELDLPRYKFIVHTIVGEMRGEGVRVGAKCFWDADTDNMVQEVFVNESLFACVVAFGVYFY